IPSCTHTHRFTPTYKHTHTVAHTHTHSHTVAHTHTHTVSHTHTHLTDEGLEEVGFVPQRVVHQAVAEGHDAVGEVVLGEPGHHALLLHVGTPRHIDDQITQVLPVPERERERGMCFNE